VHRCGAGDAWPRRVLEGVAVLQDAEALRALARPAVGAKAMSGRARARVRVPVAHAVLPPPAFLGCLSVDDVLVDAPLAGCPAQDLVRCARDVAVDANADRGVGSGVPAPRIEEVSGKRMTCGLVEGRVYGLVLRQGTRPDQGGALAARWQPGTRRQ